MLYNGMLRGFGDCGEVPSDVESKSDAFWEHLKKVSVKTRIDKAGHKFSSTMHALSTASRKSKPSLKMVKEHASTGASVN